MTSELPVATESGEKFNGDKGQKLPADVVEQAKEWVRGINETHDKNKAAKES